MFTTPEFRLMRKECPKDFKALLENLSIKPPDFDDDPEFKVYEYLDREITKKMCAEMQSLSVITGYLKLLKMAKVKIKKTDLEDDLVSTIIENEENILKATEVNIPKLPPTLERSLIMEETVVIPGLIGIGAIFSTATFFYTLLADIYFPAVTVLGTLAGVGAMVMGFRGEKRIRLAAPPTQFVKLPPGVLSKENAEAVFRTLKIIDKINKILRPPKPVEEPQEAVKEAAA